MDASGQKAVIYTSKERSFYVGKLERNLKKKNPASWLLVSTGEDLEVLDKSGESICRSRSLLIPAGLNIHINTHDQVVAKFFLDDFGQDKQVLASYMKVDSCPGDKQPFYKDFELDGDIVEFASYLSEERPSSCEAFGILNDWGAALNPGVQSLCDPRIAKVVAIIKQNHSENIPVGQLAAYVNLSIPRLIHLFNQVTGTSIRRFRNWYRIWVTAHKLSEGWSLTEAALHAGFSDYAHFSNSYRDLAGASPSAAKKHTEIHVFNAS